MQKKGRLQLSIFFVLLALLFVLRASAQAAETTTVATQEELIAALEERTPRHITLSESIELSSYIKMTGNHTLVVPKGIALDIVSGGEINIGSYQLDISGGGNVQLSGSGTILAYNGNEQLNLTDINLYVKDIGYQSLRVSTLNIGSGARITLQGAEQSAIYLGLGFSLNLLDGGRIEINNFTDVAVHVNGGTLYLDGGTLSVNSGTGEEIAISVSSGMLHYYAGNLTGACGNRILLSKGAVVWALEDFFSDRGVMLAERTQIRVNATNVLPSATGLTAGYYNWNGSCFAKESIIVTKMPESVSYRLVDRLQSQEMRLSVEAESTNGAQIAYQWFRLNADTDEFERITGANEPSYLLPSNLEVGRHVYYCLMQLEGKMDVVTYDTIVNVAPSDGYAQGSMEIGGVQHDDLQADAAGTGWYWDSAQASLTLTQEYEGLPIYIFCREADSVKLIVQGDVSIAAEATALYCAGYLNILAAEGSTARLTINGSGDISQSHAVVSVEGYLRIDSGTLYVTADGKANCAVWAHDDIVILEGASLTAIARGSEGSGISVGGEGATYSCLSIQGGNVYAIGSGYGYAIEVARTIEMTGGRLSAVNGSAMGSGAVSAINFHINGDASAYTEAGARGISLSAENNISIDTTGTVHVVTSSVLFYEYAIWTNSGNIYLKNGSLTIENRGIESNLMFGELYHTGGSINGYAPTEHEISTISFSDIESHWAYEDVLYAVDRGLFIGTSQSTFSPDMPLSRGMFITVLGRLYGINLADYPVTAFQDVNDTAYYAPYIQWAVETGIASGISETEFAPARAITRQEAVTMLYRYTALCGYELPSLRAAPVFADEAQIAPWAQSAVAALYQAEIVNGRPGGTYNPDGIATRAEACALLRRYLTNVL